MQQFSASSVFSAAVLIETVRLECYIASATLSSDGKPGFAMMLPIDDKLREKAIRTLESLASDCNSLALIASSEMVVECPIFCAVGRVSVTQLFLSSSSRRRGCGEVGSA